MAFLDSYRQQVALLIRTIPSVAQEEAFALKGGTAINLFVRDMPRLSVDIDLTYLPVADRTTSLAAIDAAMLRIGERIEHGIPGTKVNPSRSADEKIVTKLIVRADDVQIKIEITPVLRGTVYDPVRMGVVPAVEDAFGFAEMQVVSFADLYAGKIVAALDRQHPRDLFDVRDLLAHEGISDELRRAFLVYIISHNRPMAEVLAPSRKPLAEEFARGFVGMTQQPVALADLEVARETIIAAMVTDMPDAHRQFLVGFKRGEPDWELLGRLGTCLDQIPVLHNGVWTSTASQISPASSPTKLPPKTHLRSCAGRTVSSARSARAARRSMRLPTTTLTRALAR